MSSVELIYTYRVQGALSVYPHMKACEVSTAIIYNEVSDPLHQFPITIRGTNNLGDELWTAANLTSINNGFDIDFATCPTPIENVKKLHVHAEPIDSQWITALDINGNVINDYPLFGCSVDGEYHSYCEDGYGQNEQPITNCMCVYEDNGADYLGIGAFAPPTAAWKGIYNIPFNYVFLSYGSGRCDELFDDLLNGQYADTSGIAPTGGSGGGGGLYDRPDEAIDIPNLPSLSVCDTGFISLYEVSSAELAALGNYLWTSSFVENIKKVFTSPFDNIVSLQMIPFTPIGTSATIKIGNVDTGISGDKLSTSFFEVDCGTKYINEYYQTFADYAPYTKISLFLPFVGIIEIDPDDVLSTNGGGINVVYHIDVFSGSCVAFVRCNSGGAWHVLSQHAGNISAQFPITGANFASVYIGAINAIGAVAGGAAGGAMGVLAGGISGMNSIMNSKPTYERSGGITSVSGLMGIKYPYLIFSTPQYIVAENFRDVKGHVSNLKCKVSSCSGFLQASADNSELSSIPCTSSELELIRQMLSDGIYV